MRIIICGSRDIRKYGTVKEIVENSDFDIDEVISGGSRGVDNVAEIWAEYNDVPVSVFDPSDEDSLSDFTWEEDGKSAGPKRNRQMAEEADGVIAIWDGKSKGTRSMLNKAYDAELPVDVTLATEPPENDLDSEEVRRRMPEVDRIDEPYRSETIEAFTKGCPEYFWKLPTSSSGNHHPVDEIGEHGNWLHVKRMYATYEHMSRSLVECGNITEQEREIGKAAALIHDMFKYGWPDREDEHTIDYHDVIGATYIRQFTELPELAAELVEAHNGAWHVGPVPRNQHEWTFHNADMAAAQRGTNTAIHEPAEELHEISDRIITKGEE